MTSDIDKYDNNFDFSEDQKDSSALDQYGVWIKKHPEELDENLTKNEEVILNTENTGEDVLFNDFDTGTEENTALEVNTENTDKNTIENTEEINMDIDEFEELDMEGFLDENEENQDESSKNMIDDLPDFEDTEIVPQNKNEDFDESINNEIKSYEDIENKNSNDEFDSMLEDFEPFSFDDEHIDEHIEEKDTPAEASLQSAHTEENYIESDTTDDVSEFDALLDSLNNGESPSLTPEIEEKDSGAEEININIDVDETSDITSITDQKDFDEDTIALTPPISDIEMFKEKDKTENNNEKESSFIIKNTVIEPENINEIREENRKILNDGKTQEEDSFDEIENSSDEDIQKLAEENSFNDIEAFTKELTEDSSEFEVFDDIGSLDIEDNIFEEEHEEIEEHEIKEESGEVIKTETSSNTSSSNTNFDKATEILMQIASELSTIKNELANLKTDLAAKNDKIEALTAETEKTKETGEKVKNTENDNTGFFMDSDSDETIALTGDELNNILITADFTDDTKGFKEEDDDDEHEIPESLDLSFEEKKEVEINTSKSLEQTENTEIDLKDEESFEIPQELDISAIEDTEFSDNKDLHDMKIEPSHINSSNEDFRYLDEDSSEELQSEVSDYIMETEELNNIPDSQEIDLDLPELENDFDNLKETEEEIFNKSLNTSEEFKNEILNTSDITTSTEIEKEKTASKSENSGLKNISNELYNSEEKTISSGLTKEIKSVLAYMDQLLESLPDNKIKEFAESEYFDKYNRIFDELGIS